MCGGWLLEYFLFLFLYGRWGMVAGVFSYLVSEIGCEGEWWEEYSKISRLQGAVEWCVEYFQIVLLGLAAKGWGVAR